METIPFFFDDRSTFSAWAEEEKEKVEREEEETGTRSLKYLCKYSYNTCKCWISLPK